MLTDAHVVAHAYSIKVVDRSGGSHNAEVVGLDDANDVAALRVSGFAPPPVALATASEAPKVGTEVYVIGNPGGDHPNTLLQGLLSATGREFPNDAGRDYHNMYQLDTSNVLPGNSGGAVVTASGKVVGLVALGEAGAGTDGRFAYATPTSTFRQDAADWVRTPTPIPVSAADKPLQPDPTKAVVQLGELRAGYAVQSEGPTAFAGSGPIPPGDDVTYVLPEPGTTPAHQVFSRVVVYPTRAASSSTVTQAVTDFIGQGATEQPTAPIGDECHLLTQPAGDGTTIVEVIWRDRNVMAELQVQGVAGDPALQATLALARNVEQRIAGG